MKKKYKDERHKISWIICRYVYFYTESKGIYTCIHVGTRVYGINSILHIYFHFQRKQPYELSTCTGYMYNNIHVNVNLGIVPPGRSSEGQ